MADNTTRQGGDCPAGTRRAQGLTLSCPAAGAAEMKRSQNEVRRHRDVSRLLRVPRRSGECATNGVAAGGGTGARQAAPDRRGRTSSGAGRPSRGSDV